MQQARPHETPHHSITCHLTRDSDSLTHHTPWTFAYVRVCCGLSQQTRAQHKTMTHTHATGPLQLSLSHSCLVALAHCTWLSCDSLCLLCHLCLLSQAVGCTIYSVRLLSDLCSLASCSGPLDKCGSGGCAEVRKRPGCSVAALLGCLCGVADAPTRSDLLAG